MTVVSFLAGSNHVSAGQTTFYADTAGDFLVPAGVFSISAVCIGAGGAGGSGINGAGGGGGGLRWINNLAVTPGEILKITVGVSGVGFGSSIARGSTVLLFARNGTDASGNNAGVGGTGSIIGGNVGGGNGGNGGNGSPSGTINNGRSGGGGGAGGYSGNGGNGGAGVNNGDGTVGTGAAANSGGAGGGTSAFVDFFFGGGLYTAGGGGGVDVFDGSGYTGQDSTCVSFSNGGVGGSGGSYGAYGGLGASSGPGGNYGGGSAGVGNNGGIPYAGADGVVKIVWWYQTKVGGTVSNIGAARTFPSTNVSDTTYP